MCASLGPDWATHFTSFERTPFAAASIGQVHAAVLAALRTTRDQVADGRHYDALKGLRGAFARDDALMTPTAALAIAS